MDHREVRAIRGSLSRAAFARLLGVTPLTVLRWELSDDNKEARRPRAKMVELLRKLAAEGVGSASGARSADEGDEDDDASEPLELRPTPPTPDAPASPDEEEVKVQLLLDRLFGEAWQTAEDDLLRLVAGSELTSHTARTLAALGLIQVQLVCRFDVRGALLSLLPLLHELERGAAPARLRGRAQLLAAVIYSFPDLRFFDLGRVNVHAAKADALLDPHDDDLRLLLATARISACRFLGPAVTLNAYQSAAASLDRASSSLARLLAISMHSLASFYRGDTAAQTNYGNQGLEIARRLGLWPLLVAMMADYAWRSLHGPTLPEKIFEVTQYAREFDKLGGGPPGEPLIRVLACQLDALCRAGRFDEAKATAEEAHTLAKRGGVVRYALAMPVARFYVYTNRADELDAWADELDAECASAQRALANVHALTVRAMSAALHGDFERGEALLLQVCSAPASTVGIDYVAHDAHFELALTRLLRRDATGVQEALRRAFEYQDEHPSVWHNAIYQRMESFAFMRAGQGVEARKRCQTSAATFELLGDVVQVAFSRAAMAMISRATGAPDAEQRLAGVVMELQRLGVWSPQMLRRAQQLSAPPTAGWTEQTLPERLVGAIERLSVRGLSHDQYRRGLAIVLGELFGESEVVVESVAAQAGAEARSEATLVEVPDGDGLLRFGVRGSLGLEQLAALRILALFVPRVLSTSLGAEPELVTDTVLPHFIAVAPVTRQLKSEIGRLSRSSATILIGGESGVGKEVVARAVHDLSHRAAGPYVVFNCASVPRDLFESQLFGHRRGAFTGAMADSPGVIRAADGGTLFLDEIGELPLETQPKLLRFLENGEVFPLGDQVAKRVDVRVLAATHRDLDQLVRDGKFREDLYYRLNVVPLQVQPLRDRREDIVPLARMFLARLASEVGAVPELGADAVRALKDHAWPGNVRELRNVIERAMAYSPVPQVLRAEHLRILRG